MQQPARPLTSAEKCIAVSVLCEAHPEITFDAAVMIVDYLCDLHANPLDLDPQLAAEVVR